MASELKTPWELNWLPDPTDPVPLIHLGPAEGMLARNSLAGALELYPLWPPGECGQHGAGPGEKTKKGRGKEQAGCQRLSSSHSCFLPLSSAFSFSPIPLPSPSLEMFWRCSVIHQSINRAPARWCPPPQAGYTVFTALSLSQSCDHTVQMGETESYNLSGSVHACFHSCSCSTPLMVSYTNRSRPLPQGTTSSFLPRTPTTAS